MGKVVRAVIVFALLLPHIAAGVPGVEIDGLWFKLKVKAKGWAFGGPLAEPQKAAFAATCYVNLEIDLTAAEGSSPVYTVSVWSETAPGVWSAFDVDSESFEAGTGAELFLFSNMDLTVGRPDGSSIQCGAVMALQAQKLGDFNLVEKATFKSLGMDVNAGALADGSSFRGGGTLKGKTVDVADLPFTP